MIKKLTKSVGNFTHADIRKLYANGTVDCDMLIITTQTDQDTQETTEVEQYREHGTSFLEPYPFRLTAAEKESLMLKQAVLPGLMP